MARRQSLAWVELRVGLLVVVSFGLLAVAIFFVGGEAGFFTPQYTVTAYFNSANGMNTGAEVHLEGVTVGNVRTVRLTNFPEPERSVAVDMSLDLSFQQLIRADSLVTIGSIGLLGDSKVDIARGPGVGDVVPDGGAIQGQEAGDIGRIITGTNDIVANLAALSDQVQEIAARIREGEGTLGLLLTDAAIFDNANATVEEINLLIKDARTGPGTVGQLMSDPGLYDRITETLSQMESIVAKVEGGEGTLAKFINDPSVFDNVKELIARANVVVERLEDGEGTLGLLSKDETLFNDARDALAGITTMVSNVTNSEGTAGKLINDPALYNNVNQTISEVLKLVYDFRQDPKKFMTINFRLF